jgi:hypothetical protein
VPGGESVTMRAGAEMREVTDTGTQLADQGPVRRGGGHRADGEGVLMADRVVLQKLLTADLAAALVADGHDRVELLSDDPDEAQRIGAEPVEHDVHQATLPSPISATPAAC